MITIQRVSAMAAPEYLQELRKRWNAVMPEERGGKSRKILAVDGKTQRGNGGREQRASHLASAVDNGGFCLGEALAHDASNEITAVPDLVNQPNVQDALVAADAAGRQTGIARLIRKRQADYMLGLKGSQGTLHDDAKPLFQ